MRTASLKQLSPSCFFYSGALDLEKCDLNSAQIQSALLKTFISLQTLYEDYLATFTNLVTEFSQVEIAKMAATLENLRLKSRHLAGSGASFAEICNYFMPAGEKGWQAAMEISASLAMAFLYKGHWYIASIGNCKIVEVVENKEITLVNSYSHLNQQGMKRNKEISPNGSIKRNVGEFTHCIGNGAGGNQISHEPTLIDPIPFNLSSSIIFNHKISKAVQDVFSRVLGKEAHQINCLEKNTVNGTECVDGQLLFMSHESSQHPFVKQVTEQFAAIFQCHLMLECSVSESKVVPAQNDSFDFVPEKNSLQANICQSFDALIKDIFKWDISNLDQDQKIAICRFLQGVKDLECLYIDKTRQKIKLPCLFLEHFKLIKQEAAKSLSQCHSILEHVLHILDMLSLLTGIGTYYQYQHYKKAHHFGFFRGNMGVLHLLNKHCRQSEQMLDNYSAHR